ncbi:MAG: RNA polymerase sigma-70 factor (ECF subfamily) [Neolewinella sp.]|jgi:RNA polymerase sigma-70 factor (ECF subfamily)
MAFGLDPTNRRFRHYCRTGDPDALADVFDRTAGQLMRVALWLTGNRTDAEDLLQRTFLQVIETREQFRIGQPALPWLMGLLGNQARKHRRERTALPREVSDKVVDPEVEAATNELGAAVQTVRERLGEPYQEVLRLHLELGLNAKEIASRLLRPAGTVRTQLMRALELLRRKLPGGFVAGLTAITALDGAALANVRRVVLTAANAAVPSETIVAATAAVTFGGILMGKKILFAIPALALLGGAAAWLAFDSNPVAMPRTGPDSASGGFERPALPDHDSEDASATTLERIAVTEERAAEVDPGFAALRVIVRWQDDGSPARGIGLSARCRELSGAFARQAITDDEGSAMLPRLPAGVYSVTGSFLEGPLRAPGSSMPGQDKVELATGDLKTVEAIAMRTTTAAGIVVDAEDRPVADATIWVSATSSWSTGWEAGRSNADGSFRVPLRGYHYIGTRADGHVPSYTRGLLATEGPHRGLVLQLRGPAARIHGQVSDARGQPVIGARVLLGPSGGGVQESGTPGVQFTQPNPEQRFTDADGRFTATEMPPGNSSLWVWAPNFGPLRELVQVTAGTVTELQLTLPDAAIVTGVVRDARGQPIAGAGIRFGNEFLNFPQAQTRTGADGRFRLGDLPASPGGTKLVAGKSGQSVNERPVLQAGAVTEWNPVLDNGRTIRGQVLDPERRPMAGLRVGAVHPSYQRPQRWSVTDAHGRFELLNVGDDPRDVRVADGEVVLSQMQQVAPDSSDVIIALSADDLPTARLRGRILDPTGQPAQGSVSLKRTGADYLVGLQTDATTGTFTFGPGPAGSYAVEAYLTNWGKIAMGTVELEPGQETVLDDLLLQPTGSAALAVTGIDGARLASGTAHLRTYAGDHAGSCPIANGDGNFATLQPGRYFVEVLRRGRAAPQILTADFEVHSGDATAIAIRGRPWVRVNVRHRDPEPGSPKITVQYRCSTSDGKLARLFGTFLGSRDPLRVQTTLAVGNYRLEATTSDGRHAGTDLEIRLEDVGARPMKEIVVELPTR